MTRTEALNILASAIPSDCGTRNTTRAHHAEDDVTTWTTDVFDPHMPEGEDVIAHATFDEHYGQVDVTWL